MTWLLRHSSELPIRPFSDKEMETIDLDQLFEEYVETDLLQHGSDPTVDRSSSEDLAHLFELSSSNERAVFPTTPILHRDDNMAWQQAVQKSGLNPALTMSNDSSSFHVDARGKESHSDSELLNFEDLFDLERNQLRSYSQPSTPRPHTTKSVKKAVSFHQDRSIARGIHKLSRKSSTPALVKMMQPSFYRAPLPDVWRGKVEADLYGTGVPRNGITSPPPSSKLVQHENSNGFFAQHHQSYAEDQSPLASPTSHHTGMTFGNYHITPQPSPAIGITNGSSNNNDPFNDNISLSFSSSVSSANPSALQTPPSSMRLPMTTWNPNDTSPALGFGFSASPDYGSQKTEPWWDHADAAAVGPTYRQSNQRSTSQYSTTASMEGLGISCDNASFGDFGVGGLGISNGDSSLPSHSQHSAPASFDMASSHHHPHHYSTSSSNNTPTLSHQQAQPQPPQTQQQTQQQQHLYTPHPPPQHMGVPIGHPLHSRTPSPTTQPHFHRRRPSSRTAPAPSSRRKSSTCATTAARAPASNVGFVNFTPHDSRKILTGVAPSGSSKTKARREKEAAEKRRKLSQAAMQAVLDAGGDVASLKRLEREGLLVLESSRDV
jgi:hypothetical protein